MFTTQGLTVIVKGKCLIENVSVTFPTGKISTIIGANGAGKSTLFNALLGEYKSGLSNVLFQECALDRWALEDLSKVRAYIAQGARTSFALSVLDYLQISAETHAYSKSQLVYRIAEIAEKTGIEHKLSDSVTTLSGGEMQLVEFARATLQLGTADHIKNCCLLLDEPSSALDIKQRQKLYHLIIEFNKQGGTVLIIDHDINTVANLSDYIVMLKNGQVLAQGSPERVFVTDVLDECFNCSGAVREGPNRHRIYVTTEFNLEKDNG